MPVEIKELVLRAVVTGGSQEDSKPSQDSAAGADHEAVVAACVREVLRILERAKER